MSNSKAPAIRARLRYATVEEFKAGYSKFVSTGGMFIPVPESKLKPVGTDIRFQFMLNNGDTVLLGKGSVLQVRRPDAKTPNSPIGILVKFSKLSQDSKKIIDEIVAEKGNQKDPTQEVIVDEVDERGDSPTPASLNAVEPSDEQTVMGTIGEMFPGRNASALLEESSNSTVAGSMADMFPNQNTNSLLENTSGKDAEPSEATVMGTISEMFPEQNNPSSLHEPTSNKFEEPSQATVMGTMSEMFPEQNNPDSLHEPTSDKFGEPSQATVMGTISEMFPEQNDPNSLLENTSPKPTASVQSDVVGTMADMFRDDQQEPAVLDNSKLEPVAISPELAPIEPVKEVLQSPAELAASPSNPFEKSESGSARVLSYDDMSEVDPDEEFGFSGEESEIDDMFDDLFGKSGDNSFFDNILSGDSATAVPTIGSPAAPLGAAPVAAVASPAFEKPIFEPDSEPMLLDEPAFEEPVREADESVSMDDAFESDADDEVPEIKDVQRTTAPLYGQPDVYETAEDAVFSHNPPLEVGAPTAVPEQPEAAPNIEEFLLPVEAESSAADFDIEPYSEAGSPSPLAFESFEPEAPKARDLAPPAFEADISRDGELDGLLGTLETDAPLDRSFDLNYDALPAEPPVGMGEDSESLEALLALANKDIKSKKEEEKQEVDLLDELLGDDLPPLPNDVDSSFSMPIPEPVEKKKGLFKKIFGKD